MSNTNKFLNLLFNPNDYVWVVNRYKSHKNALSIHEALRVTNNMYPTEDGWTIGLNPATSHGIKHGKDNVSDYRNFLFEMDNLSIQKQRRMIEYFNIPYSSIVFSGNKSLHLVISLNEPIDSLDEYKRVHQIFWEVTYKMFDPQTNSPSTFTRIPEGQRLIADSKSTQSLVDIKERISKDELYTFIEKHDPLDGSYKKPPSKKSKSRASKKHKCSNFKRDNLGDIIENYLCIAEKVTGSGDQFSAPCPSCRNRGEDKSGNNLSINLNESLLHCFKGCDFKEVLDAIKEVIHYE